MSTIKNFEKDPALRLADGTTIRLPRPFRAREAILPGNHRALLGGFVALFDGETGAVWDPTAKRWTLQTPLTRAEFEASVAEGVRVGLILVEAARVEAAENSGLH